MLYVLVAPGRHYVYIHPFDFRLRGRHPGRTKTAQNVVSFVRQGSGFSHTQIYRLDPRLSFLSIDRAYT
ncbi:hypothetical protein DNAM5_78 [Haloarcula californiae tailed virus 1]|uniref:Uncharacterized protein n=1 Tax=Haloarcula californiae tailed virus 1 TaxID=1273746 RepID=R4TAP2_9CAUD|nr:hypothetical protein M202_gp058 [Haloarcula californiae tailed virus 1]AGM12020.1 hypothetical protein DNAM5_78 [Haloarcula californiae tailed virus 1]